MLPIALRIMAALERQLAKGDKALVGNTGYRRYLKTISDDHFAIDTDKIEEYKKFDGVFVLRQHRSQSARSHALLQAAMDGGADLPHRQAPVRHPTDLPTSSTRPSVVTCSAASSHWC